MKRRLRKLALVLESVAVGTPGQQLLDRFLVGYPRDGAFRCFSRLQISVWLSEGAAEHESRSSVGHGLEARERDFGLIRPKSLEETLTGADAVVVVGRADRIAVNEALFASVLENVSTGAVCFAYGALATTLAAANHLVAPAAKRRIALVSGTSVATTFRLPDTDIAPGTPLTEALIVVQGASPLAELWALDGLLPVLERRHGGETGVRSVHRIEGDDVWRGGNDGVWSWPLLGAAISRSDTPQGDPEKDGRTQDLVGLGLVQKLARNPRAWFIEHRDGLRTALLVLDGVVADFNFAVRARDGAITSAQLYRPPPPARAEFDRLAAVLERFFESGRAPWPIERSLLIAEIFEKVRS
jgi:hypothetical protein